MTERFQVPLPKQTNRPQSGRQSVERLVNMRAHPMEGRGQFVLEQRPGLELLATVGDGPIRGMYEFGGKLFVVSGDRLFLVTPRTGSAVNVGFVGGNGIVDMSSNLTHVVICTSNFAYYTDGSVISKLPESGLRRVAYQDGYLIYAQGGTENMFISGLDDATTIGALDFTTVDAFTDELLAVVSNYREVWAVGSRSIEVFANTGDASFPFTRFPGGFIERGTAAAQSVQKVGRQIVFLGDDQAVYRSNGYAVEPISTPGVEYLIKEQGSPSGAEAWVYAEGGRNYYVLTVNDLTLTYSFSSGLWNEESSDPNSGGRWKVRSSAKAMNEWYVGDTENGNIYRLDKDTYTDNGNELVREIVTPPIAASGEQEIFIADLFLDCEAGVGLDGSVQGSTPLLMMDWTETGGKVWSNELTTGLGAIGDYTYRPKFTRLGRASNRSFRFRVSDPIRWTVLGCYGHAEAGL